MMAFIQYLGKTTRLSMHIDIPYVTGAVGQGREQGIGHEAEAAIPHYGDSRALAVCRLDCYHYTTYYLRQGI